MREQSHLRPHFLPPPTPLDCIVTLLKAHGQPPPLHLVSRDSRSPFVSTEAFMEIKCGYLCLEPSIYLTELWWLGGHAEMLMSVKAPMTLCLPVLFCWPGAQALGWSREWVQLCTLSSMRMAPPHRLLFTVLRLVPRP